MKRRKFLQTVSAAAPATVLGSSNSATANPQSWSGRSEPKVFFYDDGRHASGLYQFASPLEPEDLVFAVDQLVDSGVDTLLYSAGLEGGVVQYGSQVAPLWGDNVDTWVHLIFYRASRNLHQLVASGHDPMKLLCDRCQEKDIWYLPTCPVCILGGERSVQIGYGRSSNFVLDNPQFWVGEDDHPQARLLGRFFRPSRMNFLHPEVRQERFRIFEELLSRYETDGVELDLSIDNEFGPLSPFWDVERLAPILTRWIADLREVADQAEKDQGRRKRIYVRIPAGPSKNWKIVGFEVETWVKEGLVDGLVCLSPYKKETPQDSIILLEQDIDLSAALETRKATSCRVLAGLSGYLGRQLESSVTAEILWTAAALAYDRGADGFGLVNGSFHPNGWPWSAEEYQTLRLLGHPDLLATADKTYHAPSLAAGNSGRTGLFGMIEALLPQTLALGKTVDVPVRVADDLERWNSLGRVKTVRLRLRMGGMDPALHDVQVQLNGKPLPQSERREIDLHFRILKNLIPGPYGYILEYPLAPEALRKGVNTVSVTLGKRDPKLDSAVGLHDLDIHIEYRLHRHFERHTIEY